MDLVIRNVTLGLITYDTAVSITFVSGASEHLSWARALVASPHVSPFPGVEGEGGGGEGKGGGGKGGGGEGEGGGGEGGGGKGEGGGGAGALKYCGRPEPRDTCEEQEGAGRERVMEGKERKDE